MSDMTALGELAKFAGKSPLASNDPARRQAALVGLAESVIPQAQRKTTDLLGMVLALSARTRRILQPRSWIDLDVFGPDGRRAARLHMQDLQDNEVA